MRLSAEAKAIESKAPDLDELVALASREEPSLDPAFLKKALEAVETSGKPLAAAHIGCLCAWSELDRSKPASALRRFEEARVSFDEAGDAKAATRTGRGIAACHASLGAFDLALQWSSRVANDAYELGDDRTKAGALTVAAGVFLSLRRLDDSSRIFSNALSLDPTERAAAQAQVGLGTVRLERGDPAGALHVLDEGRSRAHEKGLTALEAEAWGKLGRALAGMDWQDEAESHFRAGLELARRVDAWAVEAEILLHFARFERSVSRRKSAQAKLKRALEAARQTQALPVEACVLRELSELQEESGRFKAALLALKQSLAADSALASAENERLLGSFHAERTRADAAEYARLYDRISRVNELGRKIASTLDLDLVLKMGYESVSELMVTDVFGIAIHEPITDVLDFSLYLERGERKTPDKIPASSDESFGAYCFRRGADLLVRDVQKEYNRYIKRLRRIEGCGQDANSLIACPLVTGGTPIGYITAQSYKTDAYSRADLDALKAIASYIAIAVENARLFDVLNSAATTDSLTGLLNRRAVFAEGERAVSASKRFQSPLSLIMLDIDRFKRVNDEHGHDAGDEVLKALATVLRDTLRGTDMAGRYGGEEFLVIMPGTDATGALVLAERLRDALRVKRVRVPDGAECGITASFGVFTFPREPAVFESGVAAADRALYDAKNSGRDAVRVFGKK